MIKTELIPVLRQAFFDLPEAQKQVLAFLESFLIPEKEDYEFWKLFNQKEYHPEDEDRMIERVATLVENGQL